MSQKTTITARVPIEIFERIQEMELETGRTKTDIIITYLQKGLFDGDALNQSTREVASEITERMGNYKNRITVLESALQECNESNGSTGISHPLVIQIENGGISMTRDETSYEIHSVNELLDFISNLEE